MLGALTVSTLRGESGYQRKEVAKLVHYLAGEPRPDVVNLPNSMLIALAAPIRRARPPDRRDAAGRRSVPRRPRRAVQSAVARADSPAGTRRRRLRVGERVPRVHGRLSADSARRSAWCHSGSTIDLRTRAPLARAPFTIGYFARVAPEKGLHDLARRIASCGRSADCPMSRLIAAGYIGAEQRPYLEGIERRCGDRGPGRRVRVLARRARSRRQASWRRSTSCRCPRPTTSRRASILLEAMATGVPVVQPNHGAFPEMIERTGGGLLVEERTPAVAAKR